MLCKTIGNARTQVALYISEAIYRQRMLGAIRAQIINATHMVIVAVSDEQGRDVRRTGTEQLLSEVRPAVDKK